MDVKWPPQVEAQLKKVVSGVSSRSVRGQQCALETLGLLRSVVGTCRWKTARELLERIRWIGRVLIDAQRVELTVGNVVRRVLLIVREDYAQLRRNDVGATTTPSLHDVLRGREDDDALDAQVPELRQNVIEQISELYDEIATSVDPIAAMSREHLHANDIVFTSGNSDDVVAFFKASRARFETLVAETAPSMAGHRLAARLPNATVVPEAAVYALMSRVHKIVLPAHAVLANGALLTPSPGYLLALAAKQHKVPVIGLAPLYRLCPQYPHDPLDLADLHSPQDVLPYALLPSSVKHDTPPPQVLNPTLDLVPPDLIDLYLTNTGAHQPSYVYRLLAELYSPLDHDL
ncbi:hypothetical protein CTAYLR_005952 [Chrysophaeum taylorii]|uniref:Translation initiation factor eIF2B subunit beta n=1 Tax=Chrysophaeum taylorii TaxID=2483200 RepID=A0AAD7XPI5_9STRA|nr:hypothetical protein CTAYLR_005952 [Chrysophaeum taylorii]